MVAIKKIHAGNARDGVHFSAIREIKILQEMDDMHVVKLHDIFLHRGAIHLVLDCCATDLADIINEPSIPHIPLGDVKTYIQQTLMGLDAMHARWFLHRDLKPENLLVSRDEGVKIADMGLARSYGSPDRRLTHQVVTRWFRAPELLFGARAYGAGIDIWAAGCIFAQLFTRAPMFPGETDIDQLSRIFAVLGSVSEENWPGVSTLPDYIEFQPVEAAPLEAHLPGIPHDAIDLISKMLTYNPVDRISAADALQHPYFRSNPPPTPNTDLKFPPTKNISLSGGFESADDEEDQDPRPSHSMDISPAKRPRSPVPNPDEASPLKRGKPLGGTDDDQASSSSSSNNIAKALSFD